MTRFTAFAGERRGRSFASYADLYRWSVDDIPAFWAAAWDFLGIRASAPYTAVVDDLSRFPGATWFPGARLNLAENLLRYRDDRVAMLFEGETAAPVRLTYAELNQTVARLARALRAAGVEPGDLVAGYLPNLTETAMGMLATVAIGAIWSSCATDIGPQAAVDAWARSGRRCSSPSTATATRTGSSTAFRAPPRWWRSIPSIERVVVAPYAGRPGRRLASIRGALRWDDFVAGQPATTLTSRSSPFDHPAVVMFSSGTTGKPKCLVQSGGGILLNQLKELVLHADVSATTSSSTSPRPAG